MMAADGMLIFFHPEKNAWEYKNPETPWEDRYRVTRTECWVPTATPQGLHQESFQTWDAAQYSIQYSNSESVTVTLTVTHIVIFD